MNRVKSVKFREQIGLSLVEIILAVALFGLFVVPLTIMLMNSYGSNFQAEEKDIATLYAEQGLEATKSIRRQAWAFLDNGNHGLDSSSGYWEFSGSSELLEDKYTRIVTIANVCRDVGGDIVDCSQPGSTVDLYTKQAISKVNYDGITGVNNQVTLVAFLTDWQSSDWIQIDWSGGAGQSIWSDITKYDSNDSNIESGDIGQVTLLATAGDGCGVKSWPFTNAGNYIYDSDDVEITGGVAQLVTEFPANWWDSNYSYRRQITINTGNNPPANGYSGYTSRLSNFDTATLVTNSKMQADCDDLRIIYWNGSTNVDLDRHIISCDDSATDIRFKIQANITDSSSDNNYYIYYGHGSATTGLQDLDDVYLWYDDGTTDRSASYTFGRCDAWHGSGYTAWAYDAGNDYYYVDTGDNYTGCFRRAVGEQDSYIEAEFYHTGCYASNMTTGLFGRYILDTGSGASESASHYYSSNRAHQTSCGGGYGTDGDVVEGNRDATAVDGTNPGAIAINQWRKQALAAWDINNTSLKFWDSDTVSGFGPAGFPTIATNASGSDTADQENAGAWGVIAAQDNVRVRNLLIRRYTESEPTTSLAGEESGGSYPDTSPIINPDSVHEPDEVDIWSGFAETATKNGGEIYYQLSVNGTDWQYWDGSNWDDVTAASHYNTASVIDSNISSFATSSGMIFKAFLESDGSQQIQLDEIEISCQQYHDWPFADGGNYTYDSGKIEVTSGVAQLIETGSGGGGTLDGGFGLGADTEYDWPFTTAGNYTYNSSEIEVTGGFGQLVVDLTTFRITEYFLDVGTFTGTAYNLILDQDLVDNYFVIVQGSDGDGSNNNNRGPDENYVSLISDPNGTNDLNASGTSDAIGLTRDNAVDSWVGVVTVVECLADCDKSGFQLLSVERVTYLGTNQTGTDSSISSWSDINQVMLMGGFNGSGCNTSGTATGNHKSCQARIWPTGTNTINWQRDATGGSLSTAYSTIMVLEWGSEWNVQRTTVSGSAGGNGVNATGEYNTAGISSVVRANTWVWGTGWTNDGGIGDSAEGTLITLGNGVAQNTSETFVAVGQEYSDTREFEVYTLTHLNLAVDYRFKADGNSGDVVYDQTVDAATSDSGRMAIVTNGCNGTGGAYPRPIFSARYTVDNTVRLERRRSGQNFPAWVQGIDFSAIESSGVFGTTLNPSLDTDDSNWSYNDWDQDWLETDVNGGQAGIGGNTDGWAYITFPPGRSDELGGYGYQAFTTTVNNPIVTIDFDWQTYQYDATPNTFQLYVFVDSDANEPIIGQEVWSSGEQTSTQGWTSVIDIDASSKVTNAGIYYIKIAVWVETPGGPNIGPFTVGYDNILLEWAVPPAGTYSSSLPDIYPTATYSSLGVQNWDSFTETATKNGGEIYYQLSDDNSIWKYWNGSLWDVVSDATDYNTASVVNSNISNFLISTEQLSFKAFLESDGSQFVKLDNINLGLTPPVAVWNFNTWGVGGGEETPTGSRQNDGGNPNGYADITVQDGNNNKVGAFWEQAITTIIDNPTATIDFDYKVIDFSGIPDLAEIRVYLDTYPGGTPSNQVSSMINISGIGNWASASTIDVSSNMSSSDTYYLKMVLWVDTGSGGGSGPFTIGFDNVDLDWSGVSYPSDSPLINPSAIYSAGTVNEWAFFTETATKNGGEIYYQLSTDGVDWYYWDNSDWFIVGANDYNTALVVDNNISSFATSSGEISFKAFLESDNSQLVQLDNVKIGWGEESGAGGYATDGYFLSSALDMGAVSSVNIVEWDETIPSCSPVCDLKVQVRAAPDSSGSPGTWTSWYGSSGAGSYFTDSVATLISTDLNFNQWLQYRVELSGDGVDTPILEEIKINYTP